MLSNRLNETSPLHEEQSPHLGEPVIAAMKRLGGDETPARFVSRELADLDDAIMPCVLLLKNGQGLAITNIQGDVFFQACGMSGAQLTKRNELSKFYVGSLITLSKIEAFSPKDNFEKRSDMQGLELDQKSIFRAVFKSGRVAELFLVALLSNLFVFALPLFSMAVYDRIIPHRAYETLWALTLGLLIVLVIDLTSRLLRQRVHESIAREMSLRAQRNLFKRILATDVDHAPNSAGTISNAFSAVDSVCQLAPSLLVGILIDLPFVFLLFVYIGYVANWVVTVPFIAVATITAASFVLHASARKAHTEASKNNIQQMMLIEESVNSFISMKVTTSHASIFGRWSEMLGVLSKSAVVGRGAVNLSTQLSNTVIQLNTVFALVVGVFMIANGRMTVGALVSAVMLSGRALSPLISIVTGLVRMSSLTEPLSLAQRLFALPPECAGDAALSRQPIRGQVSIRNVEMRYPEAPSLSLKGINIEINPGEKVAVIGRIGSGKSTLVKLLPRLHLATSGNVIIDGHDIRQFSPDFLRRQISYMPQECDLFESSVRENILKGVLRPDDALFQEAARVSGVQQIVAMHPDGYNLFVGRGGRRLSGGERQAICLARALVRDAPVLVLDEPTSAMDGQMEQAVVARLKGFLDNKTVILATHRTPLLALVDRVIWLDDGKVVAEGSPPEIVAQASRSA